MKTRNENTKANSQLLLALLSLGLLLLAACGSPPDPGKCDLRLQKSIEGDAHPGGTATYELIVDNMGDAACAPPITVTDSLAPGVSYSANNSPNWNCSATSSNPEVVECNYTAGSIPPQTSVPLELELQFGDAACMSSNCASIANGRKPGSDKRPQFDSSPDNNRDCASVQCSHAERCTDPPAGMVGWWTGDQTSDDRSVEDNHGALQNGAHYATGQVLESFGLDGDDDFVEVPDDNSLDFDANQNFSVDAWVYPSKDRDVGYIFDKRAQLAAGITGWGLYWKSGQLNVYLHTNAPNSNGPNVTYSSANQAVPRGEWTHITVVVDRDNDTGTLYIDGAQDGTFQPSSTASGTLANSAPLYFGRDHTNNPSYYFKGRIDEVEIFDRKLSQSEVQSLVKAGPCGKCRIDCEEGKKEWTAGKDDNFAGSTEQASPSPYLQNNFAPLKPFDDATINRHFGHTFTNLLPKPEYRQICKATLVIRMQPSGSSLDTNDTIALNFSDGNGNQDGTQWSSRIGGSNGLINTQWHNGNQGSHLFTLDLANLPPTNNGSTDLLSALETYELLNVRVQDDTAVDFARLKLEYCCGDDDQERKPDVAIEKSHDGDFTVGQVGTYTISVSNDGNATAQPMTTVTDEIPKCMKIKSIKAPWNAFCNISGNTVTCNYPDPIPAGDSAPDLEIEVVPSKRCGDKVENCAKVQNDPDADPSNNSSCDQSPVVQREKKADMKIDKKALKGPFHQGQNATYELTVTNGGPDAAQGPITVTDSLPNCLQYVSASPAAWSCNASGGTVTCTHSGPLPAGQSLSLQLEVKVTRECGDKVRNCAKVDANAPTDPDMSNNESCDETIVKGPRKADLAVKKTNPKGAILFGAVSTYEITVTNNGPGAASTPITVKDALPACLEFVSGGPSPWSCTHPGGTGGTATCTHPGPLPSGQSIDLKIEVKPTRACGDRVKNCAKVPASNDPDMTNNKSCDLSRVK